MKLIKAALPLTLLFILSAYLSIGLIQHLQAKQAHSKALAELSDIKHGLLNPQAWIDQVSVIVEKRINEFELNKENRANIHKLVGQTLDRLITEVDARLRQKRQEGNFWERFKGQTTQFFQDGLLDIEQIREDVPLYTDQILDELDKPESRRDIKTLLIGYLQNLSEQTVMQIDKTRYHEAMTLYACEDLLACQALLKQKIDDEYDSSRTLAIAIILLNILIFVVGFYQCSKQKRLDCQVAVVTMILASCVLLWIGIYTPMIEVEAKISKIDMSLFDDTISFYNQVLYYQSKSIIDVIWVLFSSFDMSLMLVAGLIGLFSIIFPVAKLIASFFYYFNIRDQQDNKITAFFALKSSKWSMADVMVIAIMMAYMGFDGMISSQLSTLNRASHYVDILTTNGTAIQIGFFMFLAFCIASLFLAVAIEKYSKPLPSSKLRHSTEPDSDKEPLG